MLQRRHKGHGHRLTARKMVERIAFVGTFIGKVLIRTGLYPHLPRDQLAKIGGRLKSRAIIWGQMPLGPFRNQSQADIGADPVEPRSERAAPIIGCKSAPRGEQCFLKGVVSVMGRAEHTVAVDEDPATMRGNQTFERMLIARTGPAEKVLLALNRGGRHASSTETCAGTRQCARLPFASLGVPRPRFNLRFMRARALRRSGLRISTICLRGQRLLYGYVANFDSI